MALGIRYEMPCTNVAYAGTRHAKSSTALHHKTEAHADAVAGKLALLGCALIGLAGGCFD
eukprot:1625638-Rhodomonas_salina.1